MKRKSRRPAGCRTQPPQFLQNDAGVFGYSRISLIRHSFDMFPAWRTRQASTITAFRWLQGLGHRPAKAEITPSMLPGFRFLFAAILLSTSILVFGLGAAALLRATHEQFVSNPAWRNG